MAALPSGRGRPFVALRAMLVRATALAPDICLVYYEAIFVQRSRGRVLPTDAILPLALFTALLFVVSLCGLAASGHFPRERRAPALASGIGPLILFGSLAVSAACLGAGLVLAC